MARMDTHRLSVLVRLLIVPLAAAILFWGAGQAASQEARITDRAMASRLPAAPS